LKSLLAARLRLTLSVLCNAGERLDLRM
jgi:hypothetical protein